MREMMIQEWVGGTISREGYYTNSRKEGKAQKLRLGMWSLLVKVQA